MSASFEDLRRCPAAERERNRLAQRLIELGGILPPPVWSTNPLDALDADIESIRAEISLTLVRRFSQVLGGELSNIVGPDLLRKLDDAGVSDSYSIDCSVSLGFIRRLYKVLA